MHPRELSGAFGPGKTAEGTPEQSPLLQKRTAYENLKLKLEASTKALMARINGVDPTTKAGRDLMGEILQGKKFAEDDGVQSLLQLEKEVVEAAQAFTEERDNSSEETIVEDAEEVVPENEMAESVA